MAGANVNRKRRTNFRPKDRIVVVPWVSKREWENVFENLFSDDIENQKEALGRIEVWKSRCQPHIPLMIEITSVLLQARLEDYNTFSSADVHHRCSIIRMSYATALSRFVNLVTEFGQPSRSNTKLAMHIAAEKMGIPHWVIELRHEVNHGILPSLAILREANQLALDWIKKHYWIDEAGKVSDNEMVINQEKPLFTESVLRQLLHKYLSIRVKTIRKGKDYKKSTLVVIQHALRKRLDQDGERFFNVLLEDGIFIPTIAGIAALQKGQTESLLDLEDSSLASDMLYIWQPLLKIVHKKCAMPMFMLKLVEALETENQRRKQIIAFWLKQFLQVIQHCGSKFHKRIDKLKFMHDTRLMSTWKQLFNCAVKTPCAEMLFILPMIMELLHTPIDKEKRNLLLELMSTYMYVGNEVDPDDLPNDSDRECEIYTVDMLRKLADEKDYSCWQLVNDVDWSQWPIAELPHQVGMDVLDLDMSCHVDNLHRHTPMESESGAHFSINTHLIDADNKSSYLKPDLEARLILAKYTIQQSMMEISSQEFRQILRQVVPF